VGKWEIRERVEWGLDKRSKNIISCWVEYLKWEWGREKKGDETKGKWEIKRGSG
jgi:hypothetical protein